MRIFVRPKPGVTVRDPGDFMRPLPDEGKFVEDSGYWQRRLVDEDVVLCEVARDRKRKVAAPPKPEGEI